MNEYRLLSQLSAKLQRVLSERFTTDEMLVVAWQPDSKEYQAHQGAIRIFGLLMCALSVGLYLAYGTPPSTPLDLVRTSDAFVINGICITWLLVGLYMSCISIRSKSWARRTLYVFTTQRAVHVGARGFLDGHSFEAFSGDDLRKAKILQKPNGRIDIVLRVHRFKDEDGDPASENVGFFNISNPNLATGQLERLRGGHA